MRRARPAQRRRPSRMAGSRPSRGKFLAEHRRVLACAAAMATIGIADSASGNEPLRPYVVVGDAIPQSLTGATGDPERGRSIVVNRQVGLCLLCHNGPFPDEKFQGTL